MKERAARSPWDEKRDILIPRGPRSEGSDWVCVNGRSFQIPRGRKWQVPLPVAEVLERRDRARERAEEFRRKAE